MHKSQICGDEMIDCGLFAWCRFSDQRQSSIRLSKESIENRRQCHYCTISYMEVENGVEGCFVAMQDTIEISSWSVQIVTVKVTEGWQTMRDCEGVIEPVEIPGMP